MRTPETENLLAICLVAGCTQTLGQLWSDSCSAVLDAVLKNVAKSLGEGASEAVTIKPLSRGRSLPPIAMKGGRRI